MNRVVQLQYCYLRPGTPCIGGGGRGPTQTGRYSVNRHLYIEGMIDIVHLMHPDLNLIGANIGVV